MRVCSLFYKLVILSTEETALLPGLTLQLAFVLDHGARREQDGFALQSAQGKYCCTYLRALSGYKVRSISLGQSLLLLCFVPLTS